MPASTIDPVTEAIRNSLDKNAAVRDSNLESLLAGSAKRALLADIEFESTGSYQNTVLDKLKSKYIVLKSFDNTPQASQPNNHNGNNNSEDTLKLAKHELYPLSAVQLGWSPNSDWSVGAGMVNMGNTCYLNSTLQALFHVPAFVNWLMSDKDHLAQCQDTGGLCIICAMRKTLQDSQQRNVNSIRPLSIYNKLRLVCRNLTPGRQEDAHEFLRYLVEAMEKSYLNRFKNSCQFDSKTKETTPLNQILGGYLRSAVRCLKCGHVSTTFQHFQDLLLDIRKALTLDEALELYFAKENLDDESYHCESCQKKVPATKQFSLERPPMVLCIQLKRFSVSNNKITKHLAFRQRLDMAKYARHRPNGPLIYRLVALVTHVGTNVSCGHYTAVAQAPSCNYYQFDDSMVRPISHQSVFSTNAYIMFFELESPFPHKSNLTSIKAHLPSTITEKQHQQATVAAQKINMLIPHKTPTHSSFPASINNNNNNKSITPKINFNTTTQKDQKPNNNTSAAFKLNSVPSTSSASTTINSVGKKLLPTNSVGYTSDKVYGPQLPPSVTIGGAKSVAANSSAVSSTKVVLNGNNVSSSSSTMSIAQSSGKNKAESSSDSDDDDNTANLKKSLDMPPLSPPIKEADSSTSTPYTPTNSPQNKSATVSPSLSPNSQVSTSISSLSSADWSVDKNKSRKSRKSNSNSSSPISESKVIPNRELSMPSSSMDEKSHKMPRKGSPTSSTMDIERKMSAKSLVPYESSDTTASDESEQSGNEGSEEQSQSKVVANDIATVGEWHVTSSTDVVEREPSSQGKSWERKKPYNQQPQSSLSTNINTINNSHVVNELFKMSSSGYSAPVSSWNGTRSQLDKEVQQERREDRKRIIADSSDEGRVKRVKSHHNGNGYGKSNPGYNPIQEYHNAKNWGNNNGNNGGRSYYRSFQGNGNTNGHRRGFHHNRNKFKNFKFR